MATFTKINAFVEALAHKKHDLSADTLKVMLTNTAPNPATAAVKTDITEIAAGNGYVAGGFTAKRISSSQTGGSYTLKLNDLPAAFTATGSVGPYQYAVLYNDTAALKNLIGFWDFGGAITQLSGQAFSFDLTDAAGTVITLS